MKRLFVTRQSVQRCKARIPNSKELVAGASCWVSNNHYDVYEIPKVGHEFEIEGEFIFLAHNTDFDYWLFGAMEYRINKSRSISERTLFDTAEFLPFGSYDVITDGRNTSIKKKTTTITTNYGYSAKDLKGTFDHIGSRKRAYKTSPSKLLGKLLGITSNTKALKGGEKVKVYKKQGMRQYSNKPNNHKKINKKRTKKF